jgi:uncharacterized protein
VWSVALGLGVVAFLGRGRELPEEAPAADAQKAQVNAEQWQEFTTFIATDVQQFWSAEFKRRYAPYEPAALVLNAPLGACNATTTTERTAYCGPTHAAHFSLETYVQLKQHCPEVVGAAQAYAVAHTLGHHLQAQLKLDQVVGQASESAGGQSYALRTRLELQADCFAGVWTRRTAYRSLINASNAEQAQRCLAELKVEQEQERNPNENDYAAESFAHASARQRLYWFAQGYTSGNPEKCNTFEGAGL